MTSSCSEVFVRWFCALVSLAAVAISAEAPRCEVARAKCAYRMGCGMALHNYMVDCADLIAGKTGVCQPRCQRALIALMSSDEGQMLMDCDCDGSSFCELNKERVEVCRPEVIEATAEGSIVSCATARYICMADALCSTALDYYHRFCHGMFKGNRCTGRCRNSLSILNRQEKAAKLRTCFCDGTEDFPCRAIKQNTERLCVRGNRHRPTHPSSGDMDNAIEVIGSVRSVATTRPSLSPVLAAILVPLAHCLLIVKRVSLRPTT